MNEKIKASSIIPSARKSIHDHPGCPLKNMGRYGLNSQKMNTNRDSLNTNGMDEVDNILSKLAKHSTRDTFHRRFSWDLQNQINPDDNSDDGDSVNSVYVLSKSLPTNLKPHYSDVSGRLSKNEHHKSSESFEHQFVTHRADRSHSRINDSAESFLHNSNIENNTTLPERSLDTSTNNFFIYGFMVLVLAIGIVYQFYLSNTSLLKDSDHQKYVDYDKLQFYNDINKLGAKFRISDDSILRVKSGIASIYDRKDTSSFIFVHDSESTQSVNDFNRFMNELAHIAVKYLRNDSDTIEYTAINSQELEMATHSELINKYRENVSQSGVMLVRDIDAIPSELAMAFHYYCDEYDPLVKKSAIFFTLNTKKCNSRSVQTPSHDNIEKCLSKKWNSLPLDNVRPLLTRVVNIIVDITNTF